MNAFSMLDAQTIEGRLAQVASHETAPAPIMVDIIETDLGDDDSHKWVYDVLLGDVPLFVSRTRSGAVAWCIANGYKINS